MTISRDLANLVPTIYQTSGRVGIGEASPTFRLQVAGNNGSEVKVTRGTNDFIVSLANNLGSEVYIGPSVASPLVLQTSNTERMRILTNGTIQTVSTISVGGATPSTSGAGITFPATASASSNANTLDDYEEGDWTPALSIGTSGSVTYVTQLGTYTKIGNTVYVRGTINLSAISSPVGEIGFTGLPFTASGNHSGYFGIIRNLASSGLVVRFYTNSNLTSCSIGKNATDAGHADLQGSDLTASTSLVFGLVYQI